MTWGTGKTDVRGSTLGKIEKALKDAGVVLVDLNGLEP
jgi:hypothetical protein